VASELAGTGDAVLRALESHLDCDVFLRGNVLTLDGSESAVETARAVVRELAELIEQGHEIAPGTIEAVTRALDQHQSPAEILEDVVWRHRAVKVAPKTVNQKRYVDSIRNNTITFGIGPAGTGKTFLAVALAAGALSRREVNRIILTRPAVEAGERLGFLPGDVMAKVDPYLRPLFDALHDMLEPDRVTQHLERGAIEVAPLAFMRGRSQPLSTPVLTPVGYRPIGELAVGDLVIGSDGRPTPVLGVYPQGRRAVFRLRTDDGACTLCCAEHLWRVRTARDRRRGRPGRVLETRALARRLRRLGRLRFELPLLSAPAELEAREVALDPYTLGRWLGEAASPVRPAQAEPAPLAAHAVLAPRRSLAPAGPAGALAEAAPAGALAEAAPAAGQAPTRGIPRAYLHNRASVRIALLQGLLDSAAGGVAARPGALGRGRATVRYTTASPALRDDVVELVRSLGGVATWRTRPCAAGSAGAAVAGAGAGYQAGSAGAGGTGAGGRATYVLDIRLPPHLTPFRLPAKRALQDRFRMLRPTRRVTAIEPAGEAECVCIQVAAADSLYVTEGCLLTHNTLNDSFIILDEAQNTSPEQMKMFLTRLGFNSKMVVTGDITQIDLPREQDSGLIVVADILKDVEGIEFVRFGDEDVVRHKLVRRIVEAYNAHAQRQAPELRPRRRA